MAHTPPVKSPYNFLAKMMPPSTPEDEAEARKLGVSLEEYRALKLQVQVEQAKNQAGKSEEPPDDIVTEDELARLALRHSAHGL